MYKITRMGPHGSLWTGLWKGVKGHCPYTKIVNVKSQMHTRSVKAMFQKQKDCPSTILKLNKEQNIVTGGGGGAGKIGFVL